MNDGRNGRTGVIMQGERMLASTMIVGYVFQQERPKSMLQLQYAQHMCPHVLPWPCNSLDPSLNESVCSRAHYDSNPNEEWHDLESFKEAIVRVWDSVISDTQYMQSLYQSMVRRLQHCIANGGDIVDWTAYKGWPWCHCNHTYDYEHMSLQHVVDIVTHVHTCNTTCMYELHMHHAVCNERVVMCLVHPMQTSNNMLLFNACQQGSGWMQLVKTTNVVLSTYRCKP